MKLEKDILKVLAYFDIFHYPVTAREIRSFLHSSPSEKVLDETLIHLSLQRKIFHVNDLYFLRDDPSIVDQRRADNRRAAALLKKAYKISTFLFQFPYVRAVGISGSLSKNVADENADIDFFIITRSNRLWIARTLMHFFKKFTFLVGKQHWFCMNYYIDENALQITDKNVYTATEVVTLLPVCGNETLQQFYDANAWTRKFFLNYEQYTSTIKESKPGFFKKMAEHLFDNSIGETLDNYLMKLTTNRWTQKELEGRLNIKGGRMGLRTGKHFSKPNPAFFQQKVLLSYERKLNEIEGLFPTVRAADSLQVEA